MSSSSPPPRRRSSRRRTRRGETSGPLSRWRGLSSTWRQHYIDLGHGRISRCARRLIDAPDDEVGELRSTEISFVALSIASAASASGKVRAEKEEDLGGCVRAAIERDLPLNDVHNGQSAVELAAYHGFLQVLALLLDEGCPLKKTGLRRNAVNAAVRNGRHAALEIILSKRAEEARRVVLEEATLFPKSGYHCSNFLNIMNKCDGVSARLLLSSGCLSMSDIQAKWIFYDKIFRRHKKLERLLRSLYPSMPNVSHWRGEWHLSFPKMDRETLNWLWHLLHRPANPKLIPDEMWLRVFSYFGRGWFASRVYESIGPSGDVLERNIIGQT